MWLRLVNVKAINTSKNVWSKQFYLGHL